MSEDVDAFLFLDADDEFLPSRIDLMVNAFNKNKETDIVIGQMAEDVNGEWQVISTHQSMVKDAIVTLDRKPDILQSIGPGAKLFSSSMLDYVLMKMSFSVKSIPLLSKRSLKREIFNLYLTLYMAIMREKDQ